MSIDLRDFFAAHVAAALSARAGEDRAPEEIASRAYDLAEALLRERSFRDEPVSTLESPLSNQYAEGGDAWAAYGGDFERPGLLDEPAPMSERDLDPSWEDREIDPRWEAEPHWGPSADSGEGQSSEKPGIKSTRPPDSGRDKRHRSA